MVIAFLAYLQNSSSYCCVVCIRASTISWGSQVVDAMSGGSLYCASQGPGNAAVVQLLLQAGADVNARTASDATAMHIAACSNSGDVIRALVAAGGDARDNRAYKGKLIGTLIMILRLTWGLG